MLTSLASLTSRTLATLLLSPHVCSPSSPSLLCPFLPPFRLSKGTVWLHFTWQKLPEPKGRTLGTLHGRTSALVSRPLHGGQRPISRLKEHLGQAGWTTNCESPLHNACYPSFPWGVFIFLQQSDELCSLLLVQLSWCMGVRAKEKTDTRCCVSHFLGNLSLAWFRADYPCLHSSPRKHLHHPRKPRHGGGEGRGMVCILASSRARGQPDRNLASSVFVSQHLG